MKKSDPSAKQRRRANRQIEFLYERWLSRELYRLRYWWLGGALLLAVLLLLMFFLK